MTAEIQSSAGSLFTSTDLLFKVENMDAQINDVCVLVNEDALIILADDRTVRIWIKRDTGKYWPSMCETLASSAVCVCHEAHSRHVYLGLQNGTISDYRLARDLNSLSHQRDHLAHTGAVTQMLHVLASEWLLSCGRDNMFFWHTSSSSSSASASSNALLGQSLLNAPANCMAFDESSRTVMIGDQSGNINLIDIGSGDAAPRHFKTLNGHSEAVHSLSWDAEKARLFSSSADGTVIMWDIGAREGKAFELQGHEGGVTSLFYVDGAKLAAELGGSFAIPHNQQASAPPSRRAGGSSAPSSAAVKSGGVTSTHTGNQLVSAGADGQIIFWLLDTRPLPQSAPNAKSAPRTVPLLRQETPNWNKADKCELCARAFFWNLRQMVQEKSVAVLRQHHCRRCGRAVCARCSPSTSLLPLMGFEKRVRVCTKCAGELEGGDESGGAASGGAFGAAGITPEDEKRTLVKRFDAKQPITRIYVDLRKQLLISVGQDRVIKCWNFRSMLTY